MVCNVKESTNHYAAEPLMFVIGPSAYTSATCISTSDAELLFGPNVIPSRKIGSYQESLRIFNFTASDLVHVTMSGEASVVEKINLPSITSYQAQTFLTYSAVRSEVETLDGCASALAKCLGSAKKLDDTITIVRKVTFSVKNRNYVEELRFRIRHAGLKPLYRNQLLELVAQEQMKSHVNDINEPWCVHAMFIHQVPGSVFSSHRQVLEVRTNNFLSMHRIDEVPAHPFDQRPDVNDTREYSYDCSKSYFMARITYHVNRPDNRWMTIMGQVFEMRPEKDTSVAEGFHVLMELPPPHRGENGYHRTEFLPLKDVNENHGFYFTQESAEREQSLEQIKRQAENREKNDQKLADQELRDRLKMQEKLTTARNRLFDFQEREEEKRETFTTTRHRRAAETAATRARKATELAQQQILAFADFRDSFKRSIERTVETQNEAFRKDFKDSQEQLKNKFKEAEKKVDELIQEKIKETERLRKDERNYHAAAAKAKDDQQARHTKAKIVGEHMKSLGAAVGVLLTVYTLIDKIRSKDHKK